MDRNIALAELENTREQLLNIVNNTMDALKTSIENGESLDSGGMLSLETLYPLGASPPLFKGTKPTALFFGDEKIPVKTWRKVYTILLQRCADIAEKHALLIELCNKICGRKRVILSDKPDGMDFPIKISNGIYVEGDFDTEWLMRILTTEILDAVRFDYSDTSVSVIKNKRRGRTA